MGKRSRKKRKNQINLLKLILAILVIITIILFITKKYINKKTTTEADYNFNSTSIEVSSNIITTENQIAENANEVVKQNDTTTKSNNVENNKSDSKKESTSKETTKITYIKGILLVNKKYPLPKTYNPGVDSTAKAAFEEMKKEAAKDKIVLKIVSGFRSYSTQKAIYNNNLSKHGERIASRFSAKPGQSEHQTGLAFDLNKANRSFVGTKEAKWLANNCYKYGFIIRYPENKEAITGYVYEPWHVRYVGKQVAKDIYNKKVCLEEYLGVK